MRRIGFLGVALAATLIAGCSNGTGKDSGQAAPAATPSEPAAPSSDPAAVGTTSAADLTTQDAKDFIHHLALVNMAEIDLGKLAIGSATAAEVKKFAQMMIDDHTPSADALKALASELKIDVPGELDGKHVDQRNKLSKQSGADFDREYADAMIDAHKDLIEQLEPRIDKKGLDQWKAEKKGKTKAAAGGIPILPDKSDNKTTMRINQFAASIYPTVQAHLEAAKALESSLEKRHTTE